MDPIRKIVYEDRRSLDDFGCKDKSSLNFIIYTEWLRYRTEIDPFEVETDSYYLKAFNDAYYICTLLLLNPYAFRLKPRIVINFVERPSVVFPLVYFYLSSLNVKAYGIKEFIKDLETKFKKEKDWGLNYQDLKVAVDDCTLRIDPSQFAQRKLTPELLSTVQWELLTKTFKKEMIQEMVWRFAHNIDDWRMMLEAIKAAAQKYDYDYGFEDYEQEGFNEYGPYSEIVKVPKDPYDYDGEYVLEPLKRDGVYEFCDELMERFDELASKTYSAIDRSSSNTEQACSMELLGDQECSKGKKSPFKFNNAFLWDRVKNAVDDCCSANADFALLEITLYHHGQLYKRNDHTPFLRELVNRGLLSRIPDANDTVGEFKKVVQSMRDKARKLPEQGYMDWTQMSNDKRKCEEIGRILGDTMPYIS